MTPEKLLDKLHDKYKEYFDMIPVEEWPYYYMGILAKECIEQDGLIQYYKKREELEQKRKYAMDKISSN